MTDKSKEDEKAFAKAEYRARIKTGATLSRRQWKHFSFGGLSSEEFLDSLKAVIQQHAASGALAPLWLCDRLNTDKIRTACGDRWTPQLAAFLIAIMEPAAIGAASGTEVPPPKGPDVSAIIKRIPEMKMVETVNLWRNALRNLQDASKQARHAAAKAVLDAIRTEWERREHLPIPEHERFDWPSTEATRGSGQLLTEDWVREGVLKYMGYKVGNVDGEPPGMRERILAEVFDGPIPPVFEKPYLAEWSRPGTAARLQKMAETIAALTRNAKRRRDSKMLAAVKDWEADLQFLYDKYYIGHFRFDWPVTKV